MWIVLGKAELFMSSRTLDFFPLKDLRKDNCIHNKEYFKNSENEINDILR